MEARLDGVPAVVRLELAPLQPDARSHEPSLAVVVEVPEGAAGWTVTGAQSRVAESAGADGVVQRRLIVQGRQEVHVKIPGKFDPHAFNRFVLRGAGIADVFVRAVVWADGKPATGSEDRERLPVASQPPAEHRVQLEMPGADRGADSFDCLELVFDAQEQVLFDLAGVELWQVPAHAWLPLPAAGAALVQSGAEQRRGVGLSSLVPLETSFESDGTGELRFAYCVPESVRERGRRMLLRVRVVGAGGEFDKCKLELGGSRSECEVWREARVPLESLGAGKLRAVFSLDPGERVGEGLCAIAEVRVVRPQAEPSTVLFVTSDTHRADYVHAAGGRSETPGLDALAARGVLFTDCMSTTNLTNPSHVAMMTGTNPRDTGIVDNLTPLADSAPTLAERFRDAGWRTLAVISAPHLAKISGLDQGFDRIALPPANELSAADATARVSQWIAEAGDEPVFVWLHVFDAHTPYVPPREFIARTWPSGRDPRDPALPDPNLPRQAYLHMPEGVRDVEYMRALYDGEVGYLDQELAGLFAQARLQKAIIALTGDHGESLGEHQIWWDHGGIYPQTIRVPLILAWPDGPHGVRSQAPVQNVDVARTLLELAGIDPGAFPGQDLRGRIGAEVDEKTGRFAISDHGLRACVTVGRWFLVLALRPYVTWDGQREHLVGSHVVELYDLAADPGCTRDLAVEERERAARMRKLLIGWLGQAAGLGWGRERVGDPRLSDELARLGYGDDATRPEGPWIDPECACASCASFGE